MLKKRKSDENNESLPKRRKLGVSLGESVELSPKKHKLDENFESSPKRLKLYECGQLSPEQQKFDDNVQSIPNRWLQCPSISSSLIAGRFLALNTPLDSKYTFQLSHDFAFNPELVFQKSHSYGKKIELWIDLTNTNRYYNKDEVERKGCKYVKLRCKGRGETPSRDTVDKFLVLCQSFISINPNSMIAVHCTHGFNRTGFVIVSYLVDVLGMSLDEALTEFSDKRYRL